MSKNAGSLQPQIRDAVSYVRVSSTDQKKEGFSIPSQSKLLRGYAPGANLRIVKEFEDDETAKQAGRTDFTKMLDYLRSHTRTCKILLVEKTDRLYRNFKDYVTIDELDVEVHFVKENVIISKTSRSSEKFVHGIKVLMAKNYIDNLSEEVKKGHLEKAEEGIYPSIARIGYQNVVGPNKKRIIVPHIEIAPFVVKAFERAATGRYSIIDLTALAATDGLVTRRGHTLGKSQMHQILRNRIYMGQFTWKGKVYDGVHEPLVSRDLWDKVQGVLDGRGSKNLRRVKNDFAFWGLLRCGHCDCAMVGELKKGKYVYYHCSFGKGTKHDEPYVREEVLRDRFAAALDILHFDDEAAALLHDSLRESRDDEQKYRDEAIKRLRTELDRLQARLDAAYEDRLDGRIDVATYDRKAAVWRDEQDRARRALEEHERADKSYMDAGIRVLELSQSAKGLYLDENAREGRKVLDLVVSNSTWANGELKVTWRQPFDILADTNTAMKQKKLAGASPDELRSVLRGRRDSNPQPPDRQSGTLTN